MRVKQRQKILLHRQSSLVPTLAQNFDEFGPDMLPPLPALVGVEEVI
jgi:hypothetical protein